MKIHLKFTADVIDDVSKVNWYPRKPTKGKDGQHKEDRFLFTK